MLNIVVEFADFVNKWADGISLMIFLASIKFGYNRIKDVLKNANSQMPERVQKYIDYLEKKCDEYDTEFEKLKLSAHEIQVKCILYFYQAEYDRRR